MTDQNLELQLQSIDQKLDLISEELAVVRRQREELNELKQDLTIIAKDLFSTAIDEFEDIAPFVQTGDFLHLLKKILQNTQNITMVMTKFESGLDFFADAKPVGKELFNDTLGKLNEFDQKGYFQFIKELLNVADRVVDHFPEEDVKLLGDNIITILETVKELTQPEMLTAINNAVGIYKNLDPKDIPQYSIWKVIREINTPEIKRGIGFVITFLKKITAEQEIQNK
ncbi:DUF1641 domain-containing protein [Candidatus Neomarinimicrobiota bacterium]|jgi:uncharacterized protein YjgD (DUF1641 family)